MTAFSPGNLLTDPDKGDPAIRSLDPLSSSSHDPPVAPSPRKSRLTERYVIVTGLPASGKSTLGHAVAAALGLPMLDKDEILEALFDSLGVGDAEWRKRLSRAADEVLRRQALHSHGAVIASWWRHPASHEESGTPSEWLRSLPGALLELHCACKPEVAAERFLARKRHEGHLDRFKSHTEILAGFRQLATLGPLGVGRVVEVNTEQRPELAALLSEITGPPLRREL
ncbi:MAG TPA: AAA family ATPase [Thermoanaerobaculia bacterium]|nr:AAA family ATPase [Thermoanaerobaculia bacterium]